MSLIKRDKLSVVTYFLHTPAILPKFVQSVKVSSPGTEIIVVSRGEVGGGGAVEGCLSLTLPGNPPTAGMINLGVAEAIKAGATHLLITQPNVIFHEDAIPRLLEGFNRAKDCGAIGPITNSCWSEWGQVQQDPSFRVMDKRKLKFVNDEGSIEEATIERLNRVPYINGFCFLTSQRVWQSVGPADEGYPPLCGWEDDWIFRARIKGLLLYIDFGAFVYNLGFETNLLDSLNLLKMKERAAERICDKYQIHNRELLYNALDLDPSHRRRMSWIVERTTPLLADLSQWSDYGAKQKPPVS